MHYYGTRLSENISRREPEGYLLCLNVPVARTGTQDYLPEELGMPGSGPPGMIPVLRPESEVFSPETIASFEAMPVTNDHPPDGVDISNIRALQKGHAHNVRRGSGEESDLLLADLIITDPTLIDLILDGKREISCGYTYELCEENGQFIQRKIRGNHVAVVDAGRAGPRVCIKDQKPNEPERSTHIMKKSLSKILAHMAKDGDIETVAEIIEEMIEPEAPAEVVEEVVEAAAAAAEPEAVIETPEATIVVDEATLGDIISRLDQIISLLTPAAADEDPAGDPIEEIAEAVEEAIEAAVAAEEPVLDEDLPEGTTAEEVAEIVEEILDPISGTIDPAGDECDPEEQEILSTGDAIRAALVPMKPALAKLPKKQRARVCRDIAGRIGRKVGDSKTRGDMLNSGGKPVDLSDLGKRIMASRNVNYHKR